MIEIGKRNEGIVIFDYITESIIYFDLFQDKVLIKCGNINVQPQIKIEKNRDKSIFKEFEKILKYDSEEIYDSLNNINYQFNKIVIDKKLNKDLFNLYKNFINKMRDFNLYEYDIILEKFYLFISNVYYKKEVLGKSLVLKNS